MTREVRNWSDARKKSWAKGCRQLLEAEKGWKSDSLLKPREGIGPAGAYILDF